MIKTKKDDIINLIDLTNIKNKPNIIKNEDFGKYYIVDQNNRYLVPVTELEYVMINKILDLEKRIEKLEK